MPSDPTRIEQLYSIEPSPAAMGSIFHFLAIKVSELEFPRRIANLWISLRIKREIRGEFLQLVIQKHREPTIICGGAERVLQRRAPVPGIRDVDVSIVINRYRCELRRDGVHGFVAPAPSLRTRAEGAHQKNQ